MRSAPISYQLPALLYALCSLRHVYPARPVEPGTLRVFNWGAMRSLFLWGGAYCTGALCSFPPQVSPWETPLKRSDP